MKNQAEQRILEMIEQGHITAEEGLRLLNAMSGDLASPSKGVVEDSAAGDVEFVDGEVVEPPYPQIPEDELQRIEKLKRWWFLPFGLGLLMTILGAVWMYMGYQAKGFGFGFWISWLPFFIGIALMAISFQTSKSVWLHVRIKQKPGENPQRINISLPLPLSLTRWAMSTFGHRIPGLKDQPVEEYSEILNNLSPEEPFYVHIDDEDGEEVEVFIG
ncbi:MAG TPA: hypothetical protein ENO10_02620 [Salinimicrobium catena]|uniref:YvlB/LiaX N-terminal domain-containing protein n=1 Tax=Salinimicrobium catena TaxID=390640 RepID=A0A7C2R8B9_9FLAO|nr:hypothetical protein [Salinimicrobium catena]